MPSPTSVENPKGLPPILKSEIKLQLALTTALAVITTIVVLGRLYIRRFYIGKVELNDWVLLLAWIFLIGFTGTQLASVPTAYTLSDHLEQGVFDPDAITLKLKYDYVLIILYYACVYLTKLSILCLYLRLCKRENKLRYLSSGWLLRALTWLTLVFITLMFIPCVLVSICRCIPPSNVWSIRSDAKDVGCINRIVFFLSTSVLHIFADIVIAILPIPLVLKIRGPLIYRISLLGVLMLGLLATIACVGRLVILVEAYQGKGFFYQYATMINTWSYCECALGIIGASVPALKPVLRKIFQILGAAGWTNASCTGPQERSGQSGSLPYHIAIEENKRRIKNLHLAEAGDLQDSKCSKSVSKTRTDSSGSGSARTQSPLTTRQEVSIPLAAKLRMSGCSDTH
ncbi:hypothetical protein EYR41_005243 [Orbilia oligospora]|uniref:Rhodopsin domain-containing protein n=1 Tax=Orbilia oligospora TaxID=2813651 RepID=A0A7C8TW00_ORBOL|nr:hypothetical protein TWF751_005954 [Orbilia oligospora]KAF3294380.1 hypothetical protein TWF132_003370 [Orbilia oligospora]TGJ69185.1 hypothetical protein EYR41_005243 [Orbilia oligospora]